MIIVNKVFLSYKLLGYNHRDSLLSLHFIINSSQREHFGTLTDYFKSEKRVTLSYVYDKDAMVIRMEIPIFKSELPNLILDIKDILENDTTAVIGASAETGYKKALCRYRILLDTRLAEIDNKIIV